MSGFHLLKWQVGGAHVVLKKKDDALLVLVFIFCYQSFDIMHDPELMQIQLGFKFFRLGLGYTWTKSNWNNMLGQKF